ncbi:MAG: glycoside hydrolase family 88 protein, partial [Ruminococcus sp.]
RRNLSGNYPETSGTSLYAYSAMKSVRLGICGNSVKESGLKAFESLTRNYIYFENDIPVLKNICLVAGLGGENHRDGSAGYYLSEPVIQNDAKGIAPFIMAYTEYLKS